MTELISIYVHLTIREIQLHYISQGVEHRAARYLAHQVRAPMKLLDSKAARGKAIQRKATYIYSKYGLHLKQFEEMLTTQQNKCAICQTPITINVTPFHWQRRCVVDHCHTNGNVRGLLCSQCNTAIGLLKEDAAALERAIQYLKT